MANHLLYLRKRANRGELNAESLRAELTSELRKALELRPDLLGLYLVFQPDTLGGRDIDFRGRNDLGSNDAGRFSVYWLQAKPGDLRAVPGDEKLLADTSPGPSSAPPFNAFFTCPRDSAKLCLLEPYFDESSGSQKLVTSIAFPLLENGKVVAVIGFDISLDNLQQDAVAGGREPYEENESISLISLSGVVTGHSQDANQLGKNLQAVLPGQATEILDFLARGEPRTSIDKGQISAFQPLAPLPGAKSSGC